ncbi:MAG: agmatine deiminase family protein [Verrucomicrobia bacterium]|nr:agmatine deiminase family protein [Verrucomicrobiota bacterium]
MAAPHAQTPAALGFRMPAEWETQAAVWLSWPHNRRTWPGHFRPIPGKFAEIVAAISRFEEVRINLARPLQARARALVNRAKADLSRVRFYPHPTNDAWCRDHGPIFVKHRKTGEVAVTDWQHNAWGGKYPPFDLDNTIPPKIARALGLRRFQIDRVLEGGSIDVNGAGSLLTTESCLLNPNRNPALSRAEIEQMLRDQLGVEQILWLGDGIAGDDTDGHVDDLTRFFSGDGIVTVVERNRRDVNYAALRENRERLSGLRTPGGKRFRIVELPMPAPVYCEGQRLPASYANFLVINGAVLMPAFRQPRRDAEAAETLGACFPGRQIVPIDCVELVWGLGTLHCISQQQPA